MGEDVAGRGPIPPGHASLELRVAALEVRMLGLTMQLRDMENLIVKLGVKDNPDG